MNELININQNYYSTWCTPLTSSTVQNMVNQRTSEEVEDMFRHMEINIVQQLEHMGDQGMSEETPEQVARNIVQ